MIIDGLLSNINLSQVDIYIIGAYYKNEYVTVKGEQAEISNIRKNIEHCKEHILNECGLMEDVPEKGWIEIVRTKASITNPLAKPTLMNSCSSSYVIHDTEIFSAYVRNRYARDISVNAQHESIDDIALTIENLLTNSLKITQKLWAIPVIVCFPPNFISYCVMNWET